MASLWRQPSLEFDVKVVRVAGVEARLEGSLFVRYYVPAGDGRRRLRVDTREVPCGCGDGGGDVFWGELVRFELAGNGGAIATPGKVAFELRWRPRPSSGLTAFLETGRPSSRLLARAELGVEVGAKSASESWLRLSPASRELGSGCKASNLLVEVKIVHAVAAADHVAMKARKFGGVNECCSGGERCGSYGWVGTEEDMFLAATFTQ